ncbi:MAG: bifunctional phosphopantothenoylcysteine decarboxylase/phosphopantothenate--cysteine ligase CoaBC [Bacteriovoracaceae bacterium]|jgi:phosphopantothenoylcysteine decarboxylase / phosphopantothenate---cysteine ligase|nr:bifunctional phosphopantothenoylcysteine decarboxylase/phosphopantothenate--cysteine ligase CoaBC [Bacteriovoracaceae bacterium]
MNIVLGVCGSIASYKAYDICRNFIKDGHSVVVVLTKGATKFILPQTFCYLGAKASYSFDSDFEVEGLSEKNTVRHVDLCKWMDRLVIAPATANTIKELAHGSAYDLLTSIFLTNLSKPCVIYPAMNTSMYQNPLVQKNMDTLSALSHIFIYPPDVGELACGDREIGKLPEVDTVCESATCFVTAKNKSKRILISAGATISPLDPVRYLTNSSSGKTGYELAKAFLKGGHKVSVIAGKKATSKLEALLPLPNFSLSRVITSSEIKEETLKQLKDCDVFISSAAINDIEFEYHGSKLKKSSLDGKLDYTKSCDVLSEVLKQRSKSQQIVGFAAESQISEKVLTEKMSSKPVDLLIGNRVDHGYSGNGETSGFEVDTGSYIFLTKLGKSFEGQLSKMQLAQKIYLEVVGSEGHRQ